MTKEPDTPWLANFRGETVLVLRNANPAPPARHSCAVKRGDSTIKENDGIIIQCECGKRYRCRQDLTLINRYIWVRRLLPWPPKQSWPEQKDEDK